MNACRLYEQIDDRGHLSIDLSLKDNGTISVYFHDVGSASKEAFGGDDYEKWVNIPADQAGKLAFMLLSERYAGSINALSAIEKLCREADISLEVGSW